MDIPTTSDDGMRNLTSCIHYPLLTNLCLEAGYSYIEKVVLYVLVTKVARWSVLLAIGDTIWRVGKKTLEGSLKWFAEGI